MNPKWEPQLKLGEDLEVELLKHIQVVYPKAYRSTGNFKDFDIFVNEKNSIELKYDVMAQKTGNFAFEVRYKGKDENNDGKSWKPSGVSVTKANWFVSCDHYKFYFFETEKLRDYIKTNWPTIVKKLGGDDFKSQVCLIRKEVIVNQSFSTPFMRNNFDYRVLLALVEKVV